MKTEHIALAVGGIAVAITAIVLLTRKSEPVQGYGPATMQIPAKELPTPIAAQPSPSPAASTDLFGRLIDDGKQLYSLFDGLFGQA